MFYDSEARVRGGEDPGLPWDPFKALVAPRPIGWITTLTPDGGINLAPYSYFQAVADKPDVVMFSTTPMMYREQGRRRFSESQRKDSETNALATGEFVCNLVRWEDRRAMNLTSANLPPEVDEAQFAELEMVPSQRVRPPRVATSPAALECVVVDSHVVRHRGGAHVFQMVFGEVVGIQVRDEYIVDGRVDTSAMRLVTRMGYDEYAVLERSFRMSRPDYDLMQEGLLE